MNNKYYSDRQEKMIADYLGWKQVVGSGSRPFTPGDVTPITGWVNARLMILKSLQLLL